MKVNRDFVELLSAFAAHDVEYLVVGAHALAAHGHVRATKDLDVFQIGVAPVRIDVLTEIDGVEFDEAWAERVTSRLGGVPTTVLSRKYLIQNKRASGRLQDLADRGAARARRRRLRGASPPTGWTGIQSASTGWTGTSS